jgi:organic radical activating enzyme
MKMKKTIALFGLLLAFGCTKETPIEKSNSEYVQTNLKDPASYEKISITILDTVTVGDEIKKEKAEYKRPIKEYEQKNKELKQGAQNESVKAFIKDNNNEIDRINKLIAERCKDSSSTEIRFLKVSHKYRANNSFGAKELYNDVVSLDKDCKIYSSHPVAK